MKATSSFLEKVPYVMWALATPRYRLHLPRVHGFVVYFADDDPRPLCGLKIKSRAGLRERYTDFDAKPCQKCVVQAATRVLQSE